MLAPLTLLPLTKSPYQIIPFIYLIQSTSNHIGMSQYSSTPPFRHALPYLTLNSFFKVCFSKSIPDPPPDANRPLAQRESGERGVGSRSRRDWGGGGGGEMGEEKDPLFPSVLARGICVGLMDVWGTGVHPCLWRLGLGFWGKFERGYTIHK